MKKTAQQEPKKQSPKWWRRIRQLVIFSFFYLLFTVFAYNAVKWAGIDPDESSTFMILSVGGYLGLVVSMFRN
jgi:hypothetical protein